jgi:hypothetical protein
MDRARVVLLKATMFYLDTQEHRLLSEGGDWAGEEPFLILEALYAFPAKYDHLATREMVRETLSVIALCMTRQVPDNESQFGASVEHLTETIRKALACQL